MVLPRRFYLDRLDDESGVSGTGVVAEGTLYTNGRVSVTFLIKPFSMLWYLSIEEMIDVHGHGGRTQLVWID